MTTVSGTNSPTTMASTRSPTAGGLPDAVPMVAAPEPSATTMPAASNPRILVTPFGAGAVPLRIIVTT